MSFAEVWQLQRIGVDNYPTYEFQLEKGCSILIGKYKEADIRCASKIVSREHCKIVRYGAGGDLYVHDFGSHNGTFLNESKVPSRNSRHLRHGAVLGIGISSGLLDQARAIDDIENYFAFMVEKIQKQEVVEPSESGYIFGLRPPNDKTTSSSEEFLDLFEIDALTLTENKYIADVKCEFGSAMTAHCRFKYEPKKPNSFRIYDLSTDSKTYLNKKKIPSNGLYLQNHDEIEFGLFDIKHGCETHFFKFIFTDKDKGLYSTSGSHELEAELAGPSQVTPAPKVFVCKRIIVKSNSKTVQLSQELEDLDANDPKSENVQNPPEMQVQIQPIIPTEPGEATHTGEVTLTEEEAIDESRFMLPRDVRTKLIANTTRSLAELGMTMEDFRRIVVQSIDWTRFKMPGDGGGGDEPSGNSSGFDCHTAAGKVNSDVAPDAPDKK